MGDWWSALLWQSQRKLTTLLAIREDYSWAPSELDLNPGISMLNLESAKTEMPGATSRMIMQDLERFDGARMALRVYATHTAYKTLHSVFGTKRMPSRRSGCLGSPIPKETMVNRSRKPIFISIMFRRILIWNTSTNIHREVFRTKISSRKIRSAVKWTKSISWLIPVSLKNKDIGIFLSRLLRKVTMKKNYFSESQTTIGGPRLHHYTLCLTFGSAIHGPGVSRKRAESRPFVKLLYWPHNQNTGNLATNSSSSPHHQVLERMAWMFSLKSFSLRMTPTTIPFYGTQNSQPYVKDAFHRFIVVGEKGAINPHCKGTKSAAWYAFNKEDGVPPGGCAVVRFRLSKKHEGYLDEELFDEVIEQRRCEADEFFWPISPMPMADDLRNIQRQVLSSMMWTKQYYHFIWDQWANGDPGMPPPPPARMAVRNQNWSHLHLDDVLSMPDSWEYPFFAAWGEWKHFCALLPSFSFLSDSLILRLSSLCLNYFLRTWVERRQNPSRCSTPFHRFRRPWIQWPILVHGLARIVTTCRLYSFMQ